MLAKSIRGYNTDFAILLDNTHYFQECDPKELYVLKRLTRYNNIKGFVWNLFPRIRFFWHNIYIGTMYKV